MKEDQQFEFSVFKQRMLDFTKELVSNDMNTNLYLLLIVIQNLQFLAYYTNGLLKFNTIGFTQFQNIGKYINLVYLLQQSNINLLFVPIFTVISIIHLCMVVIGYRAYQLKIQNSRLSIKSNDFQKNRLQYFINLIMVFYTTVLTIPIFQTSITAIYCTSLNPFTKIQQCYQGSQIVIMILAVFNILWLIITNVYYTLYYFIRNPFSANFLTCSSNWWSLGKFAIKITPMIYFMYDPLIQYPLLFLITMVASYAGYLFIFRIVFPYYRYNFRLEKIVFSIQFFTCLFNFCFILTYSVSKQGIVNQSNALILSWGLLSILLTSVTLKIFINMKKKLITQIHSLDKNKMLQIQQYLLYLIDQTQNNYKTQNNRSFMVANIAKTHRQLCKDIDCYCNIFVSEAKNPNYNKNKQLFYMLLLSIIDRLISLNKKAYSFFILKAYILFYKMQSQIKAATTISKIMYDKLDFSDQILVKGLLFELNQHYLDTSDMEIYRKFNQFLLLQQQESLKIVNLYLQYWRQLIDQKSSLIKLNIIIKKIKASKLQLSRIVEGSLGIYRNHVRVLFLYKNFLKEVLNDYFGYIKCEQQYKVGVKQSKLTNVDAFNTIQFRANQNLIVINSTRKDSHSQNFGNYQIVTVSSNVKQLLGFTNTELRGQSLNKLIPRIYHDLHDKLIDKILDLHDCEIKSRSIRIFPTNSNGHIIQSNLISKFMPSILNGISIISFIEQCDKFKDQFFVIYDSNTGIVDSMNDGAETMLKDTTSKKKTDQTMVIPDHINDLIPNWDFEKQKWRTGNSAVASLKQSQYDISQVQIIRSDGINKKYIKVLKFKADYFLKMYTLQNENYAESKTVNQFLKFRNESIKQNLSKSIDNDEEKLAKSKKKKIGGLKNNQNKISRKLNSDKNSRVILIQQKPSRFSRTVFISLQSILFSICLGLICYQFITTQNNLSAYKQDASLLITLNTIRTIISDSTYINSLVSTEEAYTFTNLTLPYNSYVSAITVPPELEQLSKKMVTLTNSMNIVDPILIDRVSSNQISEDSVTVIVRYLVKEGTKMYYNQSMTVMQAIFQFIAYAQDIVYRLKILQESIVPIISSANFFYIFANNLSTIPDILVKIFSSILLSINIKMNDGYTVFIVVKILISLLIISSGGITLIYFRIIYKNYFGRVLSFYQFIRVQHIKVYQQKCLKYKYSLDLIEQKMIDIRASANTNISLRQINEMKMNEENPSAMQLKQEQEKLLIQEEMKPSVNIQEDHFLNFQSVPNLKSIFFRIIIWIFVYGIILFALCYYYKTTTVYLTQEMDKLNKYTLMVNAVIQFRLYSQLSLNMLGYWDESYLEIINLQLQTNFQTTLALSNDTTLNFTEIKPLLASKYQQFRSIQYDVLTKNHTRLNQLVSNIQSELQSMDPVLQFLQKQCPYYLNVVLSQSQNMTNKLYICFGTSLLFVISFWIFSVNYNYKKLMNQYQLAYEMYNIIGYNLKKQIQIGGLETRP